jgi:hypothetical protein
MFGRVKGAVHDKGSEAKNGEEQTRLQEFEAGQGCKTSQTVNKCE